MCGTRVECGDVFVALPAGAQEHVAVLDRDLLERFQAVDRESGAQHIDVADAASGHARQYRAGVGLQPGLRTEARLEAHDPVALAQQQIHPPAVVRWSGTARSRDRRFARSVPGCRGMT